MEKANHTLADAANVDDVHLNSMLQKSAPDNRPAVAPTETSKPEHVCEGYPADPDFQLRGGYANLMLDVAAPLFGLVMRLRTLDALPNI
ncbi:MAG: DotU family type IV/VI secretion system protein, partial [Pseudomonas sp.]